MLSVLFDTNIYGKIFYDPAGIELIKRVIDESKKISHLASSYYECYKLNRGAQGQTKMISDFKIVACASILGCDMVFSDDEKTMKNPISRKAYAVINLKQGFRTPIFYTYNFLKNRYY